MLGSDLPVLTDRVVMSGLIEDSGGPGAGLTPDSPDLTVQNNCIGTNLSGVGECVKVSSMSQWRRAARVRT